MKKVVFSLFSFAISSLAFAQSTFKAGWNTYKTASIIHEYTYNFNNDTGKISLVDSSQLLLTADSSVTMNIRYPFHDRSVYKTVNYFNPQKQIVKTEEYKDDNLTRLYEWRYDEKNRKNYYYEEDKVSGKSFRKTYEYTSDKKTGDNIVTESSYFNGRIEFYTKTYYNKHNVKYKEVRLNDNNKDVVHIESFIYGDNGKLKERSVYFPEWKVTKRFEEKEGNMDPKCAKCLPVGTAEKVTLANRMPYIKKLLVRNKVLLAIPDCGQFEYTFKNFTNCDIVISASSPATAKKVVFTYKEKML